MQPVKCIVDGYRVGNKPTDGSANPRMRTDRTDEGVVVVNVDRGSYRSYRRLKPAISASDFPKLTAIPHRAPRAFMYDRQRFIL